MRCPKCGYFGFDYLDTCRKCDRDLTEVRQELNLMDFRPEVPFLLGTLVGDEQRGLYDSQRELSLAQEAELELSGLDAGEAPGMEATVDMDGMRQTIESESPNMELGAITADDLGTIEMDAARASDSTEVKVDDLSAKEAEGVTPVGDDEGFLGLDLEMDQESSDDLSSLADSIIDSEIYDSDGTAAEKDAGDTDVLSADDSALELDLSEDDLSALAQELESQLGGDPAKKKRPDADTEILDLEGLSLDIDEDND
jgi:hypothetical protein